MHFQKVLDTFQAVVERLEKENDLQNELITHLKEQNAALDEYCRFLKKQLEEKEQQSEK